MQTSGYVRIFLDPGGVHPRYYTPGSAHAIFTPPRHSRKSPGTVPLATTNPATARAPAAITPSCLGDAIKFSLIVGLIRSRF